MGKTDLFMGKTDEIIWRGEDSNLRRLKPTDLQSVPFDRSGTPPKRAAHYADL
jgi:hypothetical protein